MNTSEETGQPSSINVLSIAARLISEIDDAFGRESPYFSEIKIYHKTHCIQ